MRSLILIGIAFAALTTLSAGQSFAGHYAVGKFLTSPVARHALCIPPAQLENVCVAWGQGQPGQLFGPCIKYQLQCVTPTVLH